MKPVVDSAHPDGFGPPRLSSVDEVLTLLASNRRPRVFLAGLPDQEDRSRRAALEP